MRAEAGRGRREFLQRVAAGILGSVAVGPGASAVSAWTGAGTNSVLNQARPDSSPLRIRSVTPFIMRMRRDGKGQLTGTHFLLCRIETEDGIVGWGEGTSWPHVPVIATEIEMVRPGLIGRSAWDIEAIGRRIYDTRAPSRGASVFAAMAAVDLALWDIVGQKLGVPVYKLLGGRVNEKIKIYTSYRWGNIPRTAEAYGRRTRELIAEGALAGKWDPFFDPVEPNRSVSLKTLREVTEMVRGIREAGPEFEICVEGHGKFNTGSAIRIARAIEPFDVLFFEEPVMPENPDAMREVQRATTTPLAAGERIRTRLEAREFIERDAFRIIQPDIARCCGITEYRKIVSLAESHFITFAPHNPNGPVCLAAHLHVAASSPGFLILEEGMTQPDLCREVFGQWEDSRAYWQVPETPGLGARFSEAFVREHSIPLDKAERS
jgi:galactonate dehydratase